MKNFKTVLPILGFLFLSVSCSHDSDNTTANGHATLQIKATATYNNAAVRSTAAAAVQLTSFVVNIREIEFNAQDEHGHGHEHNGHDNGHMDGQDDHGFFNSDDTNELQGPWVLDLLNTTAPVTSVSIPNGTYEEVEFKMSPSADSTSPIYNKTLEVRGTIDGTPFVFWHNLNEKFELDYDDPNQNLVIANGTYDLVFNFDLNAVMSHVDLSSAVDGDGDGVIEIGPDDTDGNNALATQLHQHIHGGAHMHDGPYHH